MSIRKPMVPPAMGPAFDEWCEARPCCCGNKVNADEGVVEICEVFLEDIADEVTECDMDEGMELVINFVKAVTEGRRLEPEDGSVDCVVGCVD